jgi:hypothetical protein
LTNSAQWQGLIVKAQSGFFTVKTETGFVVCQLRGRLKQGRATGDIAAGGRPKLVVGRPSRGGVNTR